MDSPPSVTVVGGGIAGLLWADALLLRGDQVTILEASERLGGKLDSVWISLPDGGRLRSEAAANSVLLTPEMEASVSRLGLKIKACDPRSSSRYVLRGSRMRRFPLSFLELLRTVWKVFHVQAEDEVGDLEAFGRRHFGEAAVRFGLVPFTAGVFGVHPRELDPRLAFPDLVPAPGQTVWARLKERRRASSRLRMVEIEGGMRGWVDALERSLRARGAVFRLGEQVEKIPTGRVIWAAGLSSLERALGFSQAPFRAWVPLVSVTVGVRKSQLRQTPQGVGVLFSEGEEMNSMGVLFSTSSFPDRLLPLEANAEWSGLTLIFGGTRSPAWLGRSEEKIQDAVRADLTKLFGLSANAELHTQIWRWTEALPVYGPDLRKRLARLGLELARRTELEFVGSEAGTLGIRKIWEATRAEVLSPSDLRVRPSSV